MKSIHIENFQAHKDLSIEFDTGITTIVGPSDVGKSAVIRALKWCMTNKPNGSGFVRDGARSCTVSLDMGDHTIVRKRGKSVNTYHMDGTEYKAFGNDVPSDILEMLNVNHLNFQSQHDSPFWFTESAGEVSRQLNQIVDLGKIDTTLSGIDSIVRRTRTELDVVKEHRETQAQKGKALKWTKKAHTDLSNVEELQAAHLEVVEEVSELTRLVDGLDKHVFFIEEAESELVDIKEVCHIGAEWEECRDTVNTLTGSIEEIGILEETAGQELPPSLDYLSDLYGDAEKVRNNRIKLGKLVDSIVQAQTTMAESTEEIERYETLLQREIGDRCPLCGNATK